MMKMIALEPGKRVVVRPFAMFDYRTQGRILAVHWCSWDGVRLYVEFDGVPLIRRTVRVDKLEGVPRLAKRV